MQHFLNLYLNFIYANSGWMGLSHPPVTLECVSNIFIKMFFLKNSQLTLTYESITFEKLEITRAPQRKENRD